VVRTAANAGVSRWRRRARELPLVDHDVAAPGPSGTGLDVVVLAALRRLPARQREVIVLRVFLDLDIETTARQLAIAPGTVRAHFSRAMTALRNELALDNTTEADPCPTTIS
jgi:DNA-directed RNA polymerase specialized sigma24 family protein